MSGLLRMCFFLLGAPNFSSSRCILLSTQRSRALSACVAAAVSRLKLGLMKALVCVSVGLASWSACAQSQASLVQVTEQDATPAADLKPQDAPTSTMDRELEQLRARRDEIEKSFDQKNKACLKKFAVTGCKIDALNEKNSLLSEIKKQEAQLSEQQKSLRSEQKLRELADRQSPEELERAKERAQRAQQAFDERSNAHAARMADHERQLKAETPPEKAPSPEKKALVREARAQSAQALYDQKIKAAAEHREELRKRLESKTVHPAPLPLPSGVQAPKGSSPL